MMTAEDREKERKRKEQLRWKQILMYYMFQDYVVKPQKEAEAEMRGAYLAVGEIIAKHGIVSRLFQKRGKEPSPAEIAMALGKLEPPNSPLGELYQEVRKNPPSEEKLTKAVERVVKEEPPRMIEAAEKEHERRKEWKRTHPESEKGVDGFELVDEERVRYEQKLELEMKLLRAVMPPELYRELAHKLESGEYTVNPERLKGQEKNEEHPRKRDYNSYVNEKRVEPQEKAGKLANAGDVYSAAAYMLAAYEQRDEPEFNEAKADARAMELSGSRAFKAYMKGHPGNLLAAARGTAIKETSDGVSALNADLSRRDAILVNTRNSLKKMATGKTACFHKMLTTLDHFVNADTEPTKDEKNGLLKALGAYITTDCSPKSREFDQECFTQAMCSVKALLPDRDFDKIVEQVNVGRDPKVKAADFEYVPPTAERSPENPTPERVPELEWTPPGDA